MGDGVGLMVSLPFSPLPLGSSAPLLRKSHRAVVYWLAVAENSPALLEQSSE